MAKGIGIVRILSNDLPTQEGGWVEISAYVKRKHIPYLAALQTVDEKVLRNKKAKPEARAREMRKLDEFLAAFVFAWDWKDQDGKPYPQPDTHEVLGELRQEEWAWLQGKANEIMAQEQEIPKANDTPS